MKKHGKILILVAMGLVMGILTWIVSSGSYNDGLFASSGITRMGLFDYFLVIYYALYYKIGDILFILSVGGLYGVLTQTDGYRKLVSKTANLIGGREHIAMLITTFVIGAYASLASQLLPILIVIPFIITVFLKKGNDRITAISAAFGGIFIGTFGLTFGTYGVGELTTAMGLKFSSGIIFKIVMFVFAYGLFNLFAILHIFKSDAVNHLKYDLFSTKKLDETGVKKNKQKKIWPTIVVLSVMFVIAIMGYINWSKSFNVNVFNDFMTKIGNVTLADVPVIKSFMGSLEAFGAWTDMLPLSFIVVLTSLVIALINKMSLFNWLENYGDGMKKMGKIALIYTLCMSVFVLAYYFNWPTTFGNWLFGSGKFSIFSLIIIAFLIATLFVDPEFSGFTFGTFLTATFAEHLLATQLIIHLGFSFAMLLVPTSFVLMIALTYLDIPYVDWLKYIWKFAVCMFVVVMIALAIMCYV